MSERKTAAQRERDEYADDAAAAREASVFGRSAVDEAVEAADILAADMAEVMAGMSPAGLEVYLKGLPSASCPHSRVAAALAEIFLKGYRAGAEIGYLAAASKAQTARKRGNSTGRKKRTHAKVGRYAEYRAFHDTLSGETRERVLLTAQKFDVSEATIYTAIKATK